LAEKNDSLSGVIGQTPAYNSVQAQFGHLGNLKHFRILVLRGKLKDFGHQTPNFG